MIVIPLIEDSVVVRVTLTRILNATREAKGTQRRESRA